MNISTVDITYNEITEADIMGENIVLTEAVYYILLSLYNPLHGYGIMQNVMELSEGRVNLAAGTLYGAINTLLEKGFISAIAGEANSRKKEYIITQKGKEIVKAEIERLRELVKNGEKIIGGAEK
jgi:DNA-binding PadR family transcriptional regulator